MQMSGIRRAVGISNKHSVMFFGRTLTRAPVACVNRNIFNAFFVFLFFFGIIVFHNYLH